MARGTRSTASDAPRRNEKHVASPSSTKGARGIGGSEPSRREGCGGGSLPVRACGGSATRKAVHKPRGRSAPPVAPCPRGRSRSGGRPGPRPGSSRAAAVPAVAPPFGRDRSGPGSGRRGGLRRQTNGAAAPRGRHRRRGSLGRLEQADGVSAPPGRRAPAARARQRQIPPRRAASRRSGAWLSRAGRAAHPACARAHTQPVHQRRHLAARRLAEHAAGATPPAPHRGREREGVEPEAGLDPLAV